MKTPPPAAPSSADCSSPRTGLGPDPAREAGSLGSSASGESLTVPLLLFAFLFFIYGYAHQDYHGGTSISRLNLLHALVLDGTFKIDQYHHNTSDKALHGGHYYSDKAPGAVLLALPGFLLAHWLAPETGNPRAWGGGGWLEKSWLATAASAGFITALGAVFFFLWLTRHVDQRTALISTLALFLGAAPFPYATMLFSHAGVVGLLAVALWCLDGTENHGSTADLRRAAVAGLCSGLALSSEFTAGIAVLALFALAMWRGWRAGLWFSTGALPALLLIPAYSWICFGSPFTLGYSHQAVFPEMQEGLYGIGRPSGIIAWKLLFSPERGLFFWSPFLLLALAGYSVLWKQSRSIFWLAVCVPLAQWIVISGYVWDWRAGWTLGPRYLSPALPFLGLAAALGIRRYPVLGILLAGLSIGLTGLGTLVNATPRYEINNPLLELHLPGLIEGRFTHNLGQLAGLPGHLSLVPLLLFALWFGILLKQACRAPHPGSPFPALSTTLSPSDGGREGRGGGNDA